MKILILLQEGLLWILSIFIAVLLITTPAAPIALGFMVVPIVEAFENPYAKIIAGFIGGLIAGFIFLNIAEVAVVWTAFQIKRIWNLWTDNLESFLGASPCPTH